MSFDFNFKEDWISISLKLGIPNFGFAVCYMSNLLLKISFVISGLFPMKHSKKNLLLFFFLYLDSGSRSFDSILDSHFFLSSTFSYCNLSSFCEREKEGRREGKEREGGERLGPIKDRDPTRRFSRKNNYFSNISCEVLN